MAYKIIRSKIFLKTVIKVISYIENEWSLNSAVNFQRILDKKIAFLSLQPRTGVKTNKGKNIRKLNITKHNKIYYRIKGNTIIVLTLFESKQNPNRNKYE